MTAGAAKYDAVIVGGGFFGCCLALHLEQAQKQRVALVEREQVLLKRASYANQARVHNGYHYPRSLLTALRCRVNFSRFLDEFAGCIVDSFEKYYAIGRGFSKVTARQYRLFCERIGAPISLAPKRIRTLFNPDLIEDVFAVRECAFDAVKLRRIVEDHLENSGVDLRCGTEALSVRQVEDGCLEVACTSPAGELRLRARQVLNCTYSRINKLLHASGLPLLYLKHEMTEMALVEVPEEIRGLGITVMCGPFFSIMPFPPLGLHTLSHVRYTPHCHWLDERPEGYLDPYSYAQGFHRRSRFTHMIKDAARFVPALAGCRHHDSIWEVKTVLPKSEVDDSRPVLWRRDCGLPNLTCLMGGKIDNIYDIIEFEDAAGLAVPS